MVRGIACALLAVAGGVAFAASLSSSEIGNFFTLSNWMPTSVSSANTPGSDPSGGGGWYIDEYTNGVDGALLPTGRKVPRSPRLTPEIAAGLNSTFEGYFERRYYAANGQSNVWDVATWGPRDSLAGFWFDPEWRRSGAPGMQDAWDYSTNRTISTRRIIDYDRIASLAAHLLRDNKLYSPLLGPTYPQWIEGTDQTDDRCWWSSTAGGVLDGDDIVPVIPFAADPLADTNAWSVCSKTFGCLDEDAVWDKNLKSYLEFPTGVMMKDLGFGQPGWNAGVARIMPATIDGVTMGHYIETNYPHADGWAITNGTRRLFSDRLCCMNQMLGLMDRTYHVPSVSYPGSGTNLWYENHLSVIGTVPLTVSPSSSGGYDVTGIGAISWGAQSATSSVSGSSLSSSGSAFHRRVSATDTVTSVTTWKDDSVTTLFGTLTDARVAQVLTQAGIGDETNLRVDFIPNPNPPSRYYVVIMDWDGAYLWRGNVSEPSTVTLSNVTMGVALDYERNYRVQHTVGRSAFGPTQPGAQCAGRVAASWCGAVLGMHNREGVEAGLVELDWVSGSFSDYASSSRSYSGRSDLLDAYDSMVGLAVDTFEMGLPADSSDPIEYVPIDTSDFVRVRNSIALSNGSVVLKDNYGICMVTCDWLGGQIRVDSVIVATEGEVVATTYQPAFYYGVTLDETHSPAVATERIAYATDIKVGIISRVDWSWKALRRD